MGARADRRALHRPAGTPVSRSTCSSCARSPHPSRADRCAAGAPPWPRPIPPSAAPATAIITRATLIRAQPLAEPGERWLRSADLSAEADRAVAVLNRVLHAQRVAAGDPALPMVTRGRVLAIRVGVGAGEQVAEAAGPAPRSCPLPFPAADPGRPGSGRPALRRDPRGPRRRARLRGAHTPRADRRRCGALARLRVPAARRDRRRTGGAGPVERPGRPRRAHGRAARAAPAVADAADAALEGGLDDTRIAALRQALERLEAALRARTNAQLGS